MNYASLKTSVADYLHRTDLTDQIPTFISLAESSLFREISAPETELVEECGVYDGYADFPIDLGTLTKVSATYGSSARLLDYIALGETPNVTGAPGYYSFENGAIRVYGASDGQIVNVYYIPKLKHLSDTVQRNWLIDNAPDLYLYASALEGAKYIRDDAEAQKLMTLVGVTVESVRRMAERIGQPRSGRLQIKPRV